MSYIKDFIARSEEKIRLHSQDNKVFYPRIRQVWYAKLGVNIGHEADGKGEFTRPVLILKKIGSLFWCVPLTSKAKQNYFHYKIESACFNNKTSYVMLSQARILDVKRFEEMLGYISEEEFEKIKNLLRNMYY